MTTKTKRTKKQKEEAFAKATKLWEILEIALEDFKVCVRSRNCEIRMSDWFRITEKKCTVCLAGAVMRQRLEPDSSAKADDELCQYYEPVDYTRDRFEYKLLALNVLRQGRVDLALHYIDEEKYIKHRVEFNREIPAYILNEKKWWKSMNLLLEDLKKLDV